MLLLLAVVRQGLLRVSVDCPGSYLCCPARPGWMLWRGRLSLPPPLLSLLPVPLLWPPLHPLMLASTHPHWPMWSRTERLRELLLPPSGWMYVVRGH